MIKICSATPFNFRRLNSQLSQPLAKLKQQVKGVCHRNSRNILFNMFTANLVDLHSIGALEEEEFALCSDQTGKGVDHFSPSNGLSWDLSRWIRGFRCTAYDIHGNELEGRTCQLDAYRSVPVSSVDSPVEEVLKERLAVPPHSSH